MDLASETPAIIEFGHFGIVPHRRELLADGQPIKLGGGNKMRAVKRVRDSKTVGAGESVGCISVASNELVCASERDENPKLFCVGAIVHEPFQSSHSLIRCTRFASKYGDVVPQYTCGLWEP